MIPKHDEIRLPALRLLTEHKQLHLRDFEAPLAKHFQLSEEEIQEEYESGNGKIFYNRIGWALSGMNIAGLLNKPRRGFYEISDLGRDKLQFPEDINKFIEDTLSERDGMDIRQKKKKLVPEESLTPQEELYASAYEIRQARYQELIDIILMKTPRAFEQLVVQLLQKMGYGDTVKESGTVTPYSNDHGIAGIIKEDVLGFGLIYIQAKRYNPMRKVQRDEIQSFVGALATAQSNKGVFFTTSSFTQGALDYAMNLSNKAIILIDGNTLAEYLYKYDVGVQLEEVIHIKKLDEDFWQAMPNNPETPG
ncbi:MAG TPA: restriction endonuclease [Candidatus Hydrogenedentes bacterium]|nr:MAG: Mrr restriction system protein [Candidatus Hydrogenedentes bacterium ADurb.Bin170]HOM49291.1 restriction endonuclease [Candidatus Hydrogenedentota bacterium]